jgi:hypothetical protein
MKYILLFSAILFVQSVDAQDFCNLVRKEMLEDKKTFEFRSPYNANEKPAVRVTRNFNTDPEYGYDNFYVNFRIEGSIDSMYEKNAEGGKTERNDKSLTVEFDDNTKFTDESASIAHDVSDDHTIAVWYLDFPLSESALKNFSTKKIVKFSLAWNTSPVPADSANAIMHYIQCIKDIKKKDVVNNNK